MGILDDAIREHLELKRRRGTDPGEIERLEQEALGPVRRSPGDAFELATEDEDGAGVEYLDEEPEPAGAWSAPADERPFMAEGSELIEDDEVEEWEEPERGPIEGAIPIEPDTPGPPTPAPPYPREAPPSRDPVEESRFLEQETVEHDVEAEHSAEPEEGEEDMLEETPEFLQDTPDHDRLWFEQRPPRDFDLDG